MIRKQDLAHGSRDAFVEARDGFVTRWACRVEAHESVRLDHEDAVEREDVEVGGASLRTVSMSC